MNYVKAAECRDDPSENRHPIAILLSFLFFTSLNSTLINLFPATGGTCFLSNCKLPELQIVDKDMEKNWHILELMSNYIENCWKAKQTHVSESLEKWKYGRCNVFSLFCWLL